jgi:hypothetical protein
MKNTFQNSVLVKSFLFLCIVLWGGYNSSVVNANLGGQYFTDFGNLLFTFFSFLYMLNAFFLFRFSNIGKWTYLPLVLLFVFLGFISETLNPMQIKPDYFYLIIFYIISPLFFIMQGMVLSMLMSKSVREKFH